MKRSLFLFLFLSLSSLSLPLPVFSVILFASFAFAQSDEVVPNESLVVEGIPKIPAALADTVMRYSEFRAASFTSWHPERREMLIATRFADTAQVHQVKTPGGARTQLTFFPDRVGNAIYSPVNGKLWLEHGGVYVLANIRGGGEFGPTWHEAGLKTHRQRIYDDFYAVAQDLVTRKITSSRRLGILGGSNGGLLMGVEFTQHAEMWNAVVIQVPLLDMLGYEHLSAGASWVGEYGSVSVPEERAFLASISPYNQLKPYVNYPEPLIFTTTKDDRVGPVHARKFAARLEEFHKPFFYDEITEGGHGEGADKKQEARTDAEYFTYLMMKLMDSTGPGQRN